MAVVTVPSIPAPNSPFWGNDVDDHDDDVAGDVTELTVRQRLDMSMQASQCPSSPVISPPSDAHRQLQEAIETEMALFTITGHRDLQQAFDYLM